MRIQLLVALLLLLSGSATQAQMSQIEFEKYTLDNGLTVLLHEDHSTPIVTVSVMYHVGSKNESPERTGFAHFFEHLMFEGSKHINRGEFTKYVENAGGAVNAYTTQDRTYYYETLPSNQLELGLWLESERMLHAKVDEEGIETQREVVKEERRQRIENQPYGSIQQEAMKRAYERHPYRWTPIGSMEDLNAASEQDYIDFYNTFYVPNNAYLSIAGDIDPAETKKLIDQYFSDIPRGEKTIPRPEVEEPAMEQEARDTVFDNIQLPAVVQTYRVPAVGTDEYYAVDMLSQMMAQGQSSRLNKALVDEQQVALAAGSIPLGLEDPGVVITFGISNVGVDPQAVENAMDAEFAKVREELIPQKEFQKLRNQIEADFVSSKANTRGIAETLALNEMYFGNANLINTEIDRYLDVSREDLREAARNYFVPENRVVLYYLPKGNQ